VPPPSDYSINVLIPMPHILSHGSPPLLESNNFENWQFVSRVFAGAVKLHQDIFSSAAAGSWKSYIIVVVA
jgi:hypothetical protein